LTLVYLWSVSILMPIGPESRISRVNFRQLDLFGENCLDSPLFGASLKRII
jgi:hypothetical protein